MTAKQISVILENKPGQLREFALLLQQHQIDMRALSVAEAEDFGILRLIVDDPYKTACVLKDAGYVFSITPVLALEIPDQPGSLVSVLNLLGENGINLEYTYAFITRKAGSAYMIFRVAEPERAAQLLCDGGYRPICQSEMSELF